MIFADDIVSFSDTEQVKTYQRLNKGRLVTVHQHSRKGDPIQTKTIEGKGSSTDNSLISSIKSGGNVPFNVAIAGLSLVGIAAGTRAFVIGAHNKQVRLAAERVLKAPPIDDLRFLSKANPQKLPDDFSQYEGVIVATGGYAGTKGQHTLDLHKYLQESYPNHLILSVENVFNDLGWEKDAVKRFSKAPSLLWNNAVKGDKTGEELALLAKNIRSKTDKPITFATASGGGMSVKNAQEITDQLGYKDIQGFGLGSPVWDLAQPKSPFISIMDKQDAGTAWLPFRSQKFTQMVDRGDQKITLKRNPYQGHTEWAKQHEYDTYLSHPKIRSTVDKMIYRNRVDKTPFQPENYTIDIENNRATNRYIGKQQSAYSKLEQQAWANFNTIFSSTAEFAEQEVKVKQYIRNGKIVRAYSANRDKALQDQNLVNRLRTNITNNIENKGVDKSTAEKLTTGALVVGGTGAALVGSKILIDSSLAAGINAGRQAWAGAFVKRTRLIDSMADDLVSGRKLFRGQTLREAIGDADTVIAVKGGINMNGKGGTLLKNNYITKMQQRGDKWAVLDLDNLELDSTGLTPKGIDLKQTASDFWNRFLITPFTKGYNDDSIELAAYMKAIDRVKPNTNKVMLGYSAGGVATVAAASDLSKMGVRTKAITFGTPYTGLMKPEDNRIVDTVTFIHKDDILANSGLSRGNKEDINAIITERPNKKTATDLLAGHGYKGYFDSKNWDKIRRIINGGSAEAFK